MGARTATRCAPQFGCRLRGCSLPGRRSNRTGEKAPAESANRQAAVFRRQEFGRDGATPWHLTGDNAATLAFRARLAIRPDEPRMKLPTTHRRNTQRVEHDSAWITH